MASEDQKRPPVETSIGSRRLNRYGLSRRRMDGAVTGYFRFGISLCKGPEVRLSVGYDLMKGLNARPKNQGLNVRALGATSGFKNRNVC